MFGKHAYVNRKIASLNIGNSQGGAIPSYRIIDDVTKCYGKNLEIICIAQGWGVQGVGNRNGHRRDDSFFGPPEVRARMAKVAPSKFGCGGARQKRKNWEMGRWVHVDADSAHKEWIAASRCKFRGIEVNKQAAFIDVPSWMWAV